MIQPEVKLLHVKLRLTQTDKIDITSVSSLRQVKMLPVRLRLAQTDRIDTTLSVSKFTSSSESESDSVVTSADCWIEGH